MKWYERLYKGRARKYLLIGVLLATGIGAPAATGLGGALDEVVEELLSGDD